MNGTFTTGFTGNAAFSLAVSGSAGLTLDAKGNIGLPLSINGGAGFPSAGLGRYVTISNAPTIYSQKGMGFVVGASGGPYIAGFGGEYNMMVDSQNDTAYHGGTFSASAGFFPTIVEIHGEVGYTWVFGCNYYDIAINAVDILIFD